MGSLKQRARLPILLAGVLAAMLAAPGRGAEVDLLVLYTPEAEALYPDTTTRIAALVEGANQIHATSGTDIVLNPVLVMPYATSASGAVSSSALYSIDNTYVDRIRDEVGADLVAMFTPPSYTSCGIAFVGQGSPSTGMYSYSGESAIYSVSGISCTERTFAHELGHNMGLSHSAAQGSVGGVVVYGRGHGVQDVFVTAMAYSSAYNAPSINRFSRYDHSDCPGPSPCGVEPGLPDEADAVRALWLVAEQVAAYRPTTVVPEDRDSDADHLPDLWEWENGLDAFDPEDALLDGDGDGWSAISEFFAATDPRDAADVPVTGTGDSDGDGVADPADDFPWNPYETLDTDGDGWGNNRDEDDDGDGMTDAYEVAHGFDTLVVQPDLDHDGDGYSTREEFRLGTNPIVAGSTPAATRIRRVSRGSNGEEGSAASGQYHADLYDAYITYPVRSGVSPSDVSGNGRWVVFESLAPNLVPGDDNGLSDVFAYDRATGEVSRVGGQGAGVSSHNPRINAAGGYVLLERNQTEAGVQHSRDELFRVELASGAADMVTNGVFAASGSDPFSGSISDDGSRVAFATRANAAPPDTNYVIDVYLKDIDTTSAELVSVTATGDQGFLNSWLPQISGDGTKVTFQSWESAFDECGAAYPGAFVRDLLVPDTRLASAGPCAESERRGMTPSISRDGRWVAFEAYRTEMADGVYAQRMVVALRDMQSGSVEVVSRAPDGSPSNGESYAPAISGNGRFVAFVSTGTNLVDGDTNALADVFLYDRVTDAVRLLSAAPGGAPADGASAFPSISADGSVVTFTSSASNLVYWDTNGVDDVFVALTGVGKAAADFDHDAVDDVLLRDTTSGRWYSYPGDALGTSGGTELGLFRNLDYQHRARADLDGDGDSDLVLRNVANGAWRGFEISDGEVIANFNLPLFVNLQWELAGSGDFDGDGDDDLLARDMVGGAWRVFEIEDFQVVGNVNPGLFRDNDWKYQTTGDLDKDGIDDVVLRASSTGAWRMFDMSGGTAARVINLAIWKNPDFRFAGAGDFDGDGDHDILAQAASNRVFRAFAIENAQVSGVYNPGLFQDSVWSLMGAVDLDGDGDQDALMRASTNGVWRVLEMSEGSSAGASNPGLPTSAQLEFQ